MSLHFYGADHGTYPDNIRDKRGKPLLSWRVVLLQYYDEPLYKKFHLDEPWNSPRNLKVAEEVPEMYRDPQGSKYTPYLGITGERAAFREGKPRLFDPKNGSNAVAVVVRDSDVLWSEPRDISLEEVKKGDRLRWRGSGGSESTFCLLQDSESDAWARQADFASGTALQVPVGSRPRKRASAEFDTDEKPRGEADLTHYLVMAETFNRCNNAMLPFPGNICDKQGKPLLSWRVALLNSNSKPDEAFYHKFHLDEPWNSPHNLDLAKEVPEMYRDPKGSKFTPYLAVSGEKGAFRPGNPRRWKSLDPKSALVVTVDKSDVFWTEPRDISPEEAGKGDRLRWDQSATDYLSGALKHEEWRKDGTGEYAKPEFEYPREPLKK